MTEPVKVEAEAPDAAQQEQAKAIALTKSAEKLLLLERTITSDLRDFAKKHNLSPSDITAYLAHINNGAAAPAWLNNEVNGVKHANTREILTLDQLVASRQAVVAEFKADASRFAGLNTDAAIAEVRGAFNNPEARADQTMIAMLNALGKVNGQDAAPALTQLAYTNSTGADAWLNGIDKGETATRWLGDMLAKAKEAADSALAAITPKAEQAAGAAGEAADSAGSWFGNLWGSIKEKFSGTSFGGIAGAGGIGALFYIIANSLAGNSWFGKIVGVMAGLFGAVLGFRTFNGDSGDAPAPHVSSISDQGRIVNDPAALRSSAQRPEQAERQVLTDAELVATLRANRLCPSSTIDTNRDCRISNTEFAAFNASRAEGRTR